jgi:WD40 repeat protein
MVSCSDDQSVIIWKVDSNVPVNRYFAHENVIECLTIIEGEHSSLLMQSDFLKHKFTQHNKIEALKELESKGSNGITSYQQPFLLTASRDKTIQLFMLNSG